MEKEFAGSPLAAPTESMTLTIDSQCRIYLLQAAKWAKFLSVMGFGGIGFVIITFAIVAALSAHLESVKYFV